MRLAVDVMGGDHGAGIVVTGAVAALESSPVIRELILVGDEAEIRRTGLAGLRDSKVRIVATTEVVSMEDGIRDVLRRKRDSSMVRAI